VSGWRSGGTGTVRAGNTGYAAAAGPGREGTRDRHQGAPSFRLPALADLAVLRFNTRGTSSARGTSEGTFGGGEDERCDVAAAISYAADAGLPGRWLLGWSFGTELALRWGLDGSGGRDIEGAILLSPPLRRPTDADLDRWAAAAKPLIALVPEFDDYLRPDEARRRFARVPTAEVIAVDHAKHLWVGESYVRIVMTEIVRQVNRAALPLPTTWAETLFRTDRRTAAWAAISPHAEARISCEIRAPACLPGDQLTGSSSMTGSSAVTARRTLGRNRAAPEATATAAAPTQTAGASPETKAVPVA
jgi:alpha/beta superfamily hydrolase